MTKIIVIPSSTKSIDNLLSKGNVDAFILGIDKISTNLPVYYSLDEIKGIINKINDYNKEVFISLNKNIHNNELDYLKEIMIELNELPIKGVIYYDIALVNLKNKLNLKLDLVWGQEHLTTNYSTINYWSQFGAPYTLLSSEITLDEIIQIKKNTKAALIVPVFGYLPMYNSVRPVISNYLKYFKIKDNSKNHYIEKEGHVYPVITNKKDTNIYSSYILNGIDESVILKNIGIDYLLINTFNIEEDKIEKIINYFKQINDDNKINISEEVNQMFKGWFDKGFLYKETVYKVKKQ